MHVTYILNYMFRVAYMFMEGYDHRLCAADLCEGTDHVQNRPAGNPHASQAI